ncbi:MAG TPA: hypothetical protein ENK23_07545 [Sorangium sp.]|nr:hypothetical protein [Sorangium sp.]
MGWPFQLLRNRPAAPLLFVGSAALAAAALYGSWQRPWLGLVLLVVICAVWLGRWWVARRSRELLKSGDVEVVLQRWADTFARVPHPETMRPLLTATACVANGWIARARMALRSAARGPAWEAALEHRLFVDSMLLTFEGETELALRQAARLQRLPVPTNVPAMARQVEMLRGAVAALARAFAHRSVDGDCGLMLAASRTSPLVHWAMRYGAAILSVDRGALPDARKLLANAPRWPDESCFAGFHREICDEVARGEAAR